MAIELSTAGILVKWITEATAGTRPTTGYHTLRGVVSIPDMNPEPNLLQTTPLSATKYHTHIFGLRNLQTMGMTVNDYTDFRTDWSSLMTAWGTAKAAGKGMWVEIAIPGLNSFYYPVEPVERGFGGAEVDTVLQTTVYFAITGEPVEAAASTGGA